jgi:serine/threonine protein kinase
MEDLVGRNLGPYRIVEQLGVGGMATVYKAFEPSMSRYVAIKVMPINLARDPIFRLRFQNEAAYITNLEHPYILPVYSKSPDDEPLPYLVMRYTDGGTLADLIAAGTLTIERTVRLVGQTAEALAYAHKQEIAHRDIKPSNILIGKDGSALLSDFGIAKIMEETFQLTGSGVAVGTPAYMSPEQAQGQKIDGRTDIYALGVVLYQALTGATPFSAETPLAVLMMHINNPLRPPSQLNPDIPEALEQVVLRAMAKHPADRFQTAEELAEALLKVSAPPTVVPLRPSAHSGSLPYALPPTPSHVSIPAPTPMQASTPVFAQTASQPPATSAPQRPARPWLWPAIAGALAVAVIGLALAMFLRPGSGSMADAPASQAGVVGASAPTEQIAAPEPTAGEQAAVVQPTSSAQTTASGSAQSTIAPNQECPSTITFGRSIHCALETEPEFDTYTFEAKANDVVALRVTAGYGVILSQTLFDSQRQEITACKKAGCTLPNDGTYSIRIGFIGSGVEKAPYEYKLYIDRFNNPVNVQPIPIAKTLTGVLETESEFDTYTFEAEANDVMALRVTAGYGVILSQTLFDPQGEEITTCKKVGCTLPNSGTYGSVIRFAPCPGILSGWTRRSLIQENDAQGCRTQRPSGPHLVCQFPHQPDRHINSAAASARPGGGARRARSCAF